jgi:hypothetical protein
MRVLVACEESGIVRRAFREKGHEAFSCDLLPARDGSEFHYQEDVLDVIAKYSWDMMIAHPPCTALTVAGNRWYYDKLDVIQEAVDFVLTLTNAPIPKIAIENPVGRLSTYWRKPDQYIQPWEFGHGETKKTGLWLKNLPLLKPTNIVEGREQKVWKMGPSETRTRDRSTTYEGIANAMAEQWG